MKKFLVFFLYFLLGPLFLNALPTVSVQAEIDMSNIQEDQPIRGLISITHDKKDAIDPNSFTLGGQPLSVEPVREVQVSPPNPLVISYFQFTLPGKAAGLYVLPELQVNIGGKAYASIPSTYEVQKPQKTPEPQKTAAPVKENKGKSELKLDLKVTGTPMLYPKQRFQAIYRFLFNTSIELTEESLPLLDPEGFSKIGTKETKDYVENGFNVQEIAQRLEAIQPGEYAFKASSIQGYAYKTDYAGRKNYLEPLLQAEAPAITLHVLPFPAKNKPPSFNGAIGPFDLFKVTLGSPSTIYVGDKILLNIDIGGNGQVDNVPLPELCCQPGFSGVFQLSDLPPSEQVKGKTKHFAVEFRPLTALVSQIPSIEFSYFVPESGQYGTLKSDPLPITIKPIEESKKQTQAPPSSPSPAHPQQPPKKKPLPPIEILGNWALHAQDLLPLPFGSWKVLWLIPIGIIAIGIQLKIKKILQIKSKAAKIKNSRDYFKEALAKPPHSTEFYLAMTQAFLSGLKEKGLISTDTDSPEQLKSEGIEGEVKELLYDIEQSLFGGLESAKEKEIIKRAANLFRKI